MNDYHKVNDIRAEWRQFCKEMKELRSVRAREMSLREKARRILEESEQKNRPPQPEQIQD